MGRSVDWYAKVATRCTIGSYEVIGELPERHGKVFLKVKCITHNETFEVRRDRFVNGAGCIKCRGATISKNKKVKTTEEMIESCRGVHGDKFDYSKAKYNTKKEPITIICPEHGEFQQRYLLHIRSEAGCPQCSKYGFKAGKPAHLYVLVDKTNNLCKVGVTNNKVHTRVCQINNSGNKQFIIYKTVLFSTGREALDVETTILNKLGIVFNTGDTSYSGSTETTGIHNIPTIINYLEVYKNE